MSTTASHAAQTADATSASEAPYRLAVIVGSTREGRFGPVVANWFAEVAGKRTDLELDVIDLADIELPAVIPAFGSQPTPAVASLGERLSAADAFVVITPEYNHSFPAGLKQAIDLFRQEWQAKPVGFVSYGGLAGGLRAVEQLRLVFAELHAVTVRDTVSFHMAWEQFDAAGQPKDPQGTGTAATVMLDQIAWWAQVLRTGRTTRPYGA
ncbi:NAD(P)H-dependent oxidoreductase [Streptomyces sp. MST-110588]|uniref:NADPH-dependent FMN reductase n=1 Tax=Streptomyces sp. MST-110588 TaxID=2833628 RepID=UPI001F5D46FB|nr:NAD(P)H-dependent oxidoreductase [Streptomyces sp. MST-110588]UNO40568.1 NAD(P)H-dependent oxidoreductase [Streptomyces sp. MST-110588]